MNKQFEYKQCQYDPHLGEFVDWKKLGLDGWELVGVIPREPVFKTIYIFKREI